jgi:RNA 2',3'-cyclic 3'-phosphodiesterase
VAKQRLKSPRARLFVALDLPDRVRDGLAAWQRVELEPLPTLRSLSPQALHVTLAFLGHHPEKRIPRLGEILERHEVSAPTLRFLPEPVPVPKSRPRLFAAAAESEGTVALQARLEEDLVAERFYVPEKRPFWPHVTLARVKRGERRVAPLPDSPRPPGDVFEARELTLYRSTLRPQGALYEPLARREL